MNNKVIDIYNHLKNRQTVLALNIAKDLYNQSNGNDFLVTKALATCHMLNEDYRSAYRYFDKANQINSKDFEVITNLASMAFENEDFEISIKFAQKAIGLEPEKHMAYLTLSNVYYISKDFDLALENISKSISILGNSIETLIQTHEDTIVLFLDILLAKDKKDEVIKIIENIENNNKFIYNVLNFKSTRLPELVNDQDISNCKNFLNELKNKPHNNQNIFIQSNVIFNIARYYHKTNVKYSDELYIQGNSLVASIQRFKPLDHQRRCEGIINNYLEIKNLHISNQNKGSGLIFVTGLPRSGTTLMESIIASNSETCAGGELNILRFAVPENFSTNLSESSLEKIGDTYIEKTNFLKKDKKFFVDKLPQNYELIGLISLALPGAKIINMQRDFWEVAISQFQQYYVKNVPFASNFFSIAINAANFEEMIRVYSKYVGSDKLINVRYEELVQNHNQMAEKLYKFCNIDASYDPIKRSKHVSTTASLNQVKRDIHSESIKKLNFESHRDDFWKNYEMQKSFWASKNVEK